MRRLSEFDDRCMTLKDQLGGDANAIRTARIIVRSMGFETLTQMIDYREKVGDFVFGYELRDLQGLGKMSIENIYSQMEIVNRSRTPGLP